MIHLPNEILSSHLEELYYLEWYLLNFLDHHSSELL